MRLVGSRVVSTKISRAVGKDWDYLCYPEEVDKWLLASDSSAHQLLQESQYTTAYQDLESGDIFEFDYRPTTITLLDILGTHQISNLNLVYTLKMSHRYLRNSPHFRKTMRDIKALRDHEAVIPAFLEEWFKDREAETYNYPHPKLNQKKNDFFDTDSGVTYTFDHDSLHEAVKLYEKPAYTFFKDDQKEVWCSRKLFEEQPEEIKLAAVYEESCVLALERSLVPFNFRVPAQKAFSMALEKVCTSITSGWFREYAWENYYKALQLYTKDPAKFIRDFKTGVNNGVVKTAKTEE